MIWNYCKLFLVIIVIFKESYLLEVHIKILKYNDTMPRIYFRIVRHGENLGDS